MTENPYASPAPTDDTAISADTPFRYRIRMAARGLFAVALIELLCFAFILLNLLADIAMQRLGWRDREVIPSFGILPDIVLCLLVIVRAAILIKSAIKITRGNDRDWASLAVNCSLAGAICPCIWLDLPFGLWIWFLLRQEKANSLKNPRM